MRVSEITAPISSMLPAMRENTDLLLWLWREGLVEATYLRHDGEDIQFLRTHGLCTIRASQIRKWAYAR